MKYKKCHVCQIEKLESEYYKKGRGLQYRCKQCVKDSMKNNTKYYDNCPKCNKHKKINSNLCAKCSRSSQMEIYPTEVIKKTIALYNEGLSTHKIAKIMNTYQVKVCRILHRNGIQLRENDFVNRGKSGEKNRAWKGYGDISGSFFSSIKNSAELRKMDFDISIEFVDKLFKLQNGKCALSGLDIFLPTSDEARILGNHTASLDRIDPTLGYLENNVQFVHKWVNFMKQNLQQEEFLFLCSKVVENQKQPIQKVEITTLRQNKRRRKKDVAQ